MKISLAWILLALASCTVRGLVHCQTTTDCVNQFGANAYCDQNGLCAQIQDGGAGDLSNDGAGSCSPAMCSDATPICNAGSCATCASPNDDPACAQHDSATPRCGTDGRCVACRASSQSVDCKSAAAPVCGASGTCRPCIASAECPGSICILTGANAGQCAASSAIAWVDNTNAGCSSGNGQSASSPLCNIDQAITMLPLRPYVHVAGSSNAYAASTALQANSGDIGPVQISGPGILASPTARVFSLGNDSFDISAAAGRHATVVLEGLEIGGSATQKGNYGINTSTTGSGIVTISVVGCFVHDNNSGGLNLGGTTTYTIANDFIAANGSPASPNAGVVIANAANGLFAFNTVASNTVSSGPSGVDCSTATKQVFASIIMNNLSVSSGPQLGTSCSQSNIVLSGVDFVGASDWHLKMDSANMACCIDKITSDPLTAFDRVDVDGTIRPKGNGWDIGAHEVQ